LRYVFIVNRHTGGGLGKRDIAAMERYFVRAVGSFDYVLPANRDEAVALTKKFLHEGADRIVSVGGDGTTNAVANGFFENGAPVNREAALVVSRMGSGFDYYRSVTMEKSPESWMDLVKNGVARFVDVGLIRFENSEYGDRYFVNMASVGMTADIVRRKDLASKKIPRALSYIAPTVKSLFAFKPQRVHVKTEGEEFSVDAMAICVSKGAYAGGGMRFGLDVKLDDGFFEITVIKKTTPLRMVAKLGKIYSGNYRDEEEITKHRATRLELRTDTPFPCEFDGETHGATNLVMEVLPAALRVCFPA